MLLGTLVQLRYRPDIGNVGLKGFYSLCIVVYCFDRTLCKGYVNGCFVRTYMVS